jgi:acyl carrier protein
MDANTVIAVLNGPACKLGAALAPDTRLMSAGLLDSLALFNLALWIEEEVGRPLDLQGFDIAQDWETPALIARFVDHEQART